LMLIIFKKCENKVKKFCVACQTKHMFMSFKTKKYIKIPITNKRIKIIFKKN
jgi:hypothetical protein